MHPASLDARKQEARRRIQAAAANLHDVIDAPLLKQPTAIEQRQPAVAQMRELEHIADLLEAICKRSGIRKAPNATEERPG